MTAPNVSISVHTPTRALLYAKLQDIASDWTEASDGKWVDSDLGFATLCATAEKSGLHLAFRVDSDSAIFVHGDAAALVDVYAHDGYSINVVGKTQEAVANLRAAMLALIPPRAHDASTSVPLTFWSYDPMAGAVRYVRSLDRLPWQDTQRNYPSTVRATLTDMCSWSAPPSGRLMVFHGPPGTGKSRFLQTLASEWSEWCSVHYVIDPDMMLGTAQYMSRVMLGDHHDDRWRLIVIEDGDEFIDANAKARSGYGVSRLLNLADGLVGQGLKVMVLVSTNIRNARFNKAMVRPGRCAAMIEFPPFPATEASQWLAASGVDMPVEQPTTLASLYAASLGGELSDVDADEELIG